MFPCKYVTSRIVKRNELLTIHSCILMIVIDLSFSYTHISVYLYISNDAMLYIENLTLSTCSFSCVVLSVITKELLST